jgi:hypothetical protein
MKQVKLIEVEDDLNKLEDVINTWLKTTNIREIINISFSAHQQEYVLVKQKYIACILYEN